MVKIDNESPMRPMTTSLDVNLRSAKVEYKLNRDIDKFNYSFETLDELRAEVVNLHLEAIMERVLRQFHLPVSWYRNLFWWEDSWEEKVPKSASMPNYIEFGKDGIEDQRRYFEPDTNKLINQFNDTKSEVDGQIFEIFNFYFDLIEYINRMSKEFGPSIKYFDKLLMSFTEVILKH